MLGGDNPAQRLLAQQMKDPFLKYFRPVNRPDGEIFYQRRFSGPPSNPAPDPGVTKEAADIYKQKTGSVYTGVVLKEPEPEPEVQTLGKSESELSRRERLRRRRDASLQFAALQKQGGKAQSGV